MTTMVPLINKEKLTVLHLKRPGRNVSVFLHPNSTPKSTKQVYPRIVVKLIIFATSFQILSFLPTCVSIYLLFGTVKLNKEKILQFYST